MDTSTASSGDTTVPKISTVPASAGSEESGPDSGEAMPSCTKKPSDSGWLNCGEKPAIHGPAEKDGFISVVGGEVPPAKRSRVDAPAPVATADDGFVKDATGTWFCSNVHAAVSRIEATTEIASRSVSELYSLVRKDYLPAMARVFEERNRAVLFGLRVERWRLDLFEHHQGTSPSVEKKYSSPPFSKFSYPSDLRVYPSLMDILCKRSRVHNFHFWCRMCDYFHVEPAVQFGDLRDFNEKCPHCAFPAIVVPCYFDGYVYYYSDFTDFDSVASLIHTLDNLKESDWC